MKIEEGESPLKRGAARSPSTAPSPRPTATRATRWCWRPAALALAQHHHFESVEEAVAAGADIIPTVVDLETLDPPRRVGDTEKGEELVREIEVLRALLRAFEANVLQEQP